MHSGIRYLNLAAVVIRYINIAGVVISFILSTYRYALLHICSIYIINIYIYHYLSI